MAYEIHAVHSKGAETVIETGKRFISAYEGRCGDGWVLSVDRKTHEGTLQKMIFFIFKVFFLAYA